MVCTFIGHHNCPDSIKSDLLNAIENRIALGTELFYVGTHGNFDAMALSCLRSLKREHPSVRYAVVLAYLPANQNVFLPGETVFPEGIENVPRRFVIHYRNRWMIERADTVICYWSRLWGGTAKGVQTAKKTKATVINLFDRAGG